MSSIRNTILENQQNAAGVSLFTDSTATKTQCSLTLAGNFKAGKYASGTLASSKNLTNPLLTGRVQLTSSNTTSSAGLLKSGTLSSSFTQCTLLKSGNATSGNSLALLSSNLSSLRTTSASLAPLTSSHLGLQPSGHSALANVKTGYSSALLTSGHSLLAKYSDVRNESMLTSRKRPLDTGMVGSKAAKKSKWEPKVTLLDNFAEENEECDDEVEYEQSAMQVQAANLFDLVAPRPTSSSTAASDSVVDEANTRLKLALVNAVLGAMIGSPSLRNATDPTRCAIVKLVHRVAAFDGEFVLKVAVFARRVIGLRAVSNLLVAVSALDKRIRPSLRKYFRAAVELPSDWLEVVEQYRTFVDPKGSRRRITLPSALRRAMAAKFADFDEYQLAKYNTERNRAKRRSYEAKFGKKVKKAKKQADKPRETDTNSGPQASQNVRRSRSPSQATSASRDKSNAESEAEDVTERTGTSKSGSSDESEKSKQDSSDSRSRSSTESDSRSSSPSFVRPRIPVATNNKWAVLAMDMEDDFALQMPKPKKRQVQAQAAKQHASKVTASSQSLSRNEAATTATTSEIRGRGRGSTGSIVSVSQRGGRGAASTVSTFQRGGRAISMIQRGGRGGSNRSSQADKDDSDETAKRMAKPIPKPDVPPFTLKMLVRLLHISQPADLVLGLLGKRYPPTMTDFVRMRMDGVFDEARAGQRMRLRTPVTWETQVSATGSCASTWEQLIDSNKLPFMATLRNLRNLLVSGVSLVHHRRVLAKLTSPQAVRASRQFPFRFLSAFLVLDELERFKAKQDNPPIIRRPAPRKIVARNRRTVAQQQQLQQQKPVIKNWQKKPIKFDLQLINRYRAALEKAVQISAMWNLDPIRGCTWIVLDYGLLRGEKIAQKIGRLKVASELAVLLSCLAKFCCEKCVLIVMTGDTKLHKQIVFDSNKSENILNDMTACIKEAEDFYLSNSTGESKEFCLPQVLTDTLFTESESPIDTLMFLSALDKDAGTFAASKQQQLAAYVQQYRLLRNQKLLFVNIDLRAAQSKIVDSSVTTGQSVCRSHPNDINIAGFSDQILRFVATRGNERLLSFIDKIGRALRATEQRKKTPNAAANAANEEESDEEDNHMFETDHEAPKPAAQVTEKILMQPKVAWRTVRVFISSTFADMHGERDFIGRFVIPPMRERVRALFVDLVDIDLRWGVRNESQSSAALETCLNEVRRADLLVALIGDRRGWQPALTTYPDFVVDALTDTSKPSLHANVLGDWSWLAGRSEKQLTPDQRSQLPSITELEIITFINAKKDLPLARNRTFFFLRDSAFLESVPLEHRAAFTTESAASRAYLAKIKANISASQFEVFPYSCKFAGLFEGRPIVSNLNSFANQLRKLLWNTISQMQIRTESEAADRPAQVQNASLQATHSTRFESMNIGDCFVSRAHDLKSCVATLTDATTRLRQIRAGASSLMLLLSGEAGSGRSSFAVNLVQFFIAQRNGSSAVCEAARKGAKKMKNDKTALVLSHFAEGASSQTHDLPSALRRFISETLKSIEQQRGAQIAQRVTNRLHLDEHEGNDINWLVDTFCKLCAFAMQLFSGVYVLMDDIDRCCSAASDCITPALFIQRVAETLKAPFGFLLFIVTMSSSSSSFRDTNALIVQHGEKIAKLAQSAIVAKQQLQQQQNSSKALQQKQVVAHINQQTQTQGVETKLPNLALTHFRLGAINANVRADLVRKYFSRFGKSLRESLLENEVQIIKNKRDGGNPLYLVTACEELRLIAQFNSIDAQIREIPQTLTTLLGRILERLEGEFGAHIVRAAALLVAHSLNGLHEFELRSLLTAALTLGRNKQNAALLTDGAANVEQHVYKTVSVKPASQYASRADHKVEETVTEFYQNALSILLDVRKGKRALLSQAGVSRLCYELRQFLSPGSIDSNSPLIIAHRSAREALENRYLSASASISSGKDKNRKESVSLHCHALLAAYYDAQLRTIELLGSASTDMFSCLLHHAEKLRHTLTDWYQLQWVVTDLSFVFRVLLAGKKQTLLDAYSLLLEVEKEGWWASKVSQYNSFVLRVTGVLCSKSEDPAALFIQSALNEPHASQPYYDTELLLHGYTPSGQVFLRCVNKPEFSMLDKSTERFQWNVVCTACALSPLPSDCQLIALGYEDGIVRVYEYSRGALHATLKGHTQQVTHLLFVNRTSASLLVSSSVDHAINVWNVKGAYRVAQLLHHDRTVSACVFDHVSANLISVGFDARVCFWSLESFRLMGETSETKPISCIAQRPQSDEFVTGSWDCQLKIYAASTRKIVSCLLGHTSALKRVVWTAQRIISCSMDGEIRIWSQREGGAFHTVGIILQPSVVNALAVSECGNFLTTANTDKTLCVYRTRIGTQLYNVKLAIDNDDDDENGKGLAGDRPHSIVLADDVIIVGTVYGSVHFYNRQSGRYKYSVKTDVKEASNTLLALPSSDAAPKIVYVCQHSTVTVLQRTDNGNFCAVASFIGFPTQPTVPITAISCSLNVLAITNAGGNVVVFESGEKEVNAWAKDAKACDSRVCSESLREHEGQIVGCALSLSQQYLATVGRDCALVIYKIGSTLSSLSLQVLHKQSKAHADWVTSVCWSNFDDSKLVTASEDCSITVWKADQSESSTSNSAKVGWQAGRQVDGWQPIRENTFKAPAPYTRVQLCADLIVASCRNGYVYAWNTDGLLVTDFSCAQPGTFEGISMDCTIMTQLAGVEPSAGSTTSAASIQQKRQQLEDIRTRNTNNFLIAAVAGSRLGLYQPLRTRRLETLLGHSDRVIAVAMKQQSIISSSLDSTVREWSVPQLAESSSDMNTDDDTFVGPVTCLENFVCPATGVDLQDPRIWVVIGGTKLGYLLVATFLKEYNLFTLASPKLLSQGNAAVNSLCLTNVKVEAQADGSTHFIVHVYCGLNDSTITELLVTICSMNLYSVVSTVKISRNIKVRDPVTCLRFVNGGSNLLASDFRGNLLELDTGSLQLKRKYKYTEQSGVLCGFRTIVTPHGEIYVAWSSDRLYVIETKLGRAVSQITLESAEREATTTSACKIKSITDIIALQNGGEVQILVAVNDGRVLPLKLSYAPNQCTTSWTGDSINSNGDQSVNGLCAVRLNDEDIVITGGDDCSIRFWNTAKAKQCGEVIGRSQIRALSIAEVETRNYLAVGDDVGRIGLFSFAW